MPVSRTSVSVRLANIKAMAGLDEVRRIVLAFPDTEESPGVRTRFTYFRTTGPRGGVFATVSEDERTVMIKATLTEQSALIAEAPDVYSPGYTSRSYGWVTVNLARVPADELAELLTEARRLVGGAP